VARESQARPRNAGRHSSGPVPSRAAGSGSVPPRGVGSGSVRGEPGARGSGVRPAPEHAPKNRRVPKKATKPKGPSLAERAGVLRARTAGVVTRHARALKLVGQGSAVLAVLGVAVVLGLGLERYLKTAPGFALDTIDIDGTVRMERGEVLEAAGVDLGTNVFAKSPDEIRRDLLAHEWIEHAEVTRRLPAKLSIHVTERKPAALLVVDACAGGPRDESPECDDGSSLHLVSDDGKVFKRHDAADPVDLPIITGIDRTRYGAEPEQSRELLLAAVALIHAYQGEELSKRFPLGEVHIEEGQAFSMYVGEDLTLVRLGVAPFAPKLRRMKKVFEQLEREGARAEYIYLDNEERPDRVAVRLR
jgi:cell division protein FtsQ